MLRIITSLLLACGFSLALATTALPPLENQGNPPGFDTFVKQLKQRLEHDGFSKKLVDDAFKNVYFIHRTVYKVKHQPELKLSLSGYLKHMMVPGRIVYGREYMQKHAALLKKIGEKYKVQPKYIVALLGLESSYGRVQGKYPEVATLATLIYEGNRPQYFYKELTYALRILKRQDATVDDLKGSWAGAMGQPQFLPTHFYDYAVDFDHNGKKDIWNNTDDVLASIAHTLSRYGWKEDNPIVIPVTTTEHAEHSLFGWKQKHPVRLFLKHGVRLPEGAKVDLSLPASVINIGDAQFMIFKNFRILHHWNRSRFYVMAVLKLADLISEPAPKKEHKA